MKTVSAAELQRNIGRYQDLALREPVAITRNGREGCVLLSTHEFNRLKRIDREMVSFDTASQQKLEEVADLVSKSEMPSGHEHLNVEPKAPSWDAAIKSEDHPDKPPLRLE